MRVYWTYPDFGREEMEAVQKVMESGRLSQGEVTRQFEKELATYLGCKYVTVVNNGTSALVVALLAHNLSRANTVIVPTFTFAAPIEAVLAVGAFPTLVDCDRRTFNLDVDAIKRNKRGLGAVVCVDVCGMPCDLDLLEDLCEDRNLILIEDAAEAFGAECRHRRVGSFDHTTVFSFHVAKIISTIEGGCIATNNEEIDAKCKSIRSHGMLPKQRGEYNHALFGLNFRTTDVQSAIGLTQLKKVKKYLEHRNKIASLYKDALPHADFDWQFVPSHVTLHPYMVFQLLIRRKGMTAKIVDRLESKGVEIRRCWKPVHMQQAYQGRFSKVADLSNSEWVYEHAVALPIGNVMPTELVEYVVNCILEVF